MWGAVNAAITCFHENASSSESCSKAAWIASFSLSVRNRNDVGVRGRTKKDTNTNATEKILSYEYEFHQSSASGSDGGNMETNEGNYILE